MLVCGVWALGKLPNLPLFGTRHCVIYDVLEGADGGGDYEEWAERQCSGRDQDGKFTGLPFDVYSEVMQGEVVAWWVLVFVGYVCTVSPGGQLKLRNCSYLLNYGSLNSYKRSSILFVFDVHVVARFCVYGKWGSRYQKLRFFQAAKGTENATSRGRQKLSQALDVRVLVFRLNAQGGGRPPSS